MDDHVSPGANAVLDRIIRVESENRRLARSIHSHRWAMAAMTVLIAVVSFTGWFLRHNSEILNAARLNVTDSSGKNRASLYYDREGNETVFAIYDQKGDPRILLNVGADSTPSISIYDSDTIPRIVSSFHTNGFPMQVYYAKNGAEVLTVGQEADGFLGLQYFDNINGEKAKYRVGVSRGNPVSAEGMVKPGGKPAVSDHH